MRRLYEDDNFSKLDLAYVEPAVAALVDAGFARDEVDYPEAAKMLGVTETRARAVIPIPLFWEQLLVAGRVDSSGAHFDLPWASNDEQAQLIAQSIGQALESLATVEPIVIFDPQTDEIWMPDSGASPFGQSYVDRSRGVQAYLNSPEFAEQLRTLQ